ncbi:MAG: ABC transporter permease [Nitrospirae bacterium]|nr:ABC transporter permease [Nitrospirota bacterium]
MDLFLLKMAWRETRAGWRHFLYFLTCIAFGVGAVVGIGLFASNVERAVLREARGLLGGDLEIRVSHALSEAGRSLLQSLATRGIETSHASELVAMAATVTDGGDLIRPATQLVELKAVEDNYPLYGKLALEPKVPLTELLAPPASSCSGSSPSPDPLTLTPHPACYGAVVQASLLIRMGLSVGQPLRIGQATFRITGVITTEPDRMANMFSLGPRVLISQQGLAGADLVKPGSRVRERYLLKLPVTVSPQPLLYELRGRLAPDSVRVSSYRDAQPQLKQFLDQLSRYLSLIGLTALFVGGIGVAMSVQAFLREKLESIAVLKTLGAGSGTVISVYLAQTLVLAMGGSACGVALGLLLQAWLPQALVGLLQSNLLEQVEFSSALSGAALVPLVKGFALGVLTTVLFTLWPLWQIREMQPARIFRQEVTASESGPGPVPLWLRLKALASRLRRGQDLIAMIGVGGGLLALSMWQASSWQLGGLFMGGLLVAVLLLLAGATGLLSGLRALPRPRSIGARYAIGNLGRPGGHAIGVILALGISVMVIVTVAVIERSLVAQLGESRPVQAPTFFFIDIQPDQADGFAGLLHARAGELSPQLIPLVRARLHAMNGRLVKAEEPSETDTSGREEKRKAWYLTREYVLTVLDALPKDNVVVKGAWWPPASRPAKPLVSVEEDAAKSLGLDVGSTVTLEIQGATMTAEVSSIRKVDWGNFSTNFYMILSPGSLDGAPFTYVATVRVPPQDEVPLQQAVVASFPNVTAINIGDVLDSFTRILDRLSLAIQAVALFCVVTGGLVMGAALAATRYRRLYESVILKALGATRGLIARSFAIEYLLVGTVAGLIGVGLASALAWAVLRYVFDLSWTLQLYLLVGGLLLTLLFTVLIGFLGTFGILGQRPLPILRRE